MVNNKQSFEDKFKAFNFNTVSVDGQDVEEISKAIDSARDENERPTAIILNTAKGKGCSFAEGKFNHHIPVTEEQATEAIAAIEQAIAEI